MHPPKYRGVFLIGTHLRAYNIIGLNGLLESTDGRVTFTHSGTQVFGFQNEPVRPRVCTERHY